MVGGLLAILVAWTFVPAFDNDWTPIDDDKNFLLNPHFGGLGAADLQWMLTTRHMGHYIPLTWLTLGLDRELWDYFAPGYRLTSLALHMGGALLLYLLALRLLPPHPLRPPAAALGAAFFAVHPMRVESVVWISERRDVLCGLLSLLCVHAYLTAARADSERRRRWLALALALFAGALLAKGLAVALPIALVALDWAALGRLPRSPRDWLALAARPVWKEKAPFFALAALSVPGTLWASREVLVPTGVLPITTRLAAAVYSLGFYCAKTIVPWPLPFQISWQRLDQVSLAQPGILVRAALLLALFALGLALRRRAPALLAATIVSFAIVLPVSGLLQAGPQLAAHRYTYLFCLPWALLLADGALQLAARRAIPAPRATAFVLALLVAFVATLLATRTRDQERLWQNRLSVARAMVESAPDAFLPRYTLGQRLLTEGRWPEAMTQLRKGLALNARSLELLHLTAIALATIPRDDLRDGVEAKLLADRVVAATSYQDPWALFGLSVALAENGEYTAAERVARSAMHLARGRTDGIGALLGRAAAAAARHRSLRLEAGDFDEPPPARAAG